MLYNVFCLSIFQNLCTEIDGHEPLIVALYERGDEMINENHPQAEEVRQLKDSLQLRWESLKELSDEHQENLDKSLQSKQVCTYWV